MSALGEAGFAAALAGDLLEVRMRVERAEPTAVVLARVDAARLAQLRRWRVEERRPVVLVIAPEGTAEPARAVAAGASDYLPPDPPPETVLTRLRLHLRQAASPRALELGPRRVDLEGRLVDGPEGPVSLTAIEARLLGWLAARPGEAVSSAELLREVWGHSRAVRTRAVANTVMRLRRKIEDDPQAPRWLRTVREVGYALDVPPPPPTRSRAPGPLIGRAEALEEVEAALLRHPLVALWGPPGVGKSRLALEVADRTGAAVAHVEAEALETEAALLTAIAMSLGVAAPHAARLADLAPALAGRGPTLLWLDGLNHVVDAVAAAAPAWGGIEGLRVLVTTQTRLPTAAVRWIALPPLDPASAMRLLAERARRIDPRFDLDGAAKRAARDLVARLGHLPLAIVVAAAQMRFYDLARLAERPDVVLAADGARDHAQGSVRRALDAAGARLDPAARRLLAVCGLVPGPFDLPWLEAALGPADGAPWSAALEALLDRALVQSTGAPGGFVLAESVRAWVAEQPRDPAVTRRFAEATVARAEAAAARLPLDGAEELAACMPALDSLPTADPDLRLRAALAVGTLLELKGLTVGHLDRLVGIDAADDPLLRGRAWCQRARCLRLAGRRAEAGACLDRALSAHPDVAPEVWWDRATLAVQSGLSAEAKEAVHRGIEAAEATGDVRTLGRLLDRRATALFQQGDLAGAERVRHRALRLLEQAGLEWDAAVVRFNQGDIHAFRRELGLAERCQRPLAELATAIGHWAYAASARFGLGRVQQAQGNPAAEALIADALAEHRRMGDLRGQMLTLTSLAISVLERGDGPRARHQLHEALALAESLRLRGSISRVTLWLGLEALVDGRLDDAAAWLDEAAEAMRRLGRDQVLAHASAAQALLAHARGETRVGPPAGQSVDQAMSAALGALVAASAAGDRAALLTLRDGPVARTSALVRTLLRCALRPAAAVSDPSAA